MPFSDSARKQFQAIVPDNPASPTVPAHLQGIVDAIEGRTVLRASTWSWANTFIAPFSDGMLVYIEDVDELHLRRNGAWVKIHPTSYSGTGEPSPSLGANGDLYFMTV
jgi:hypothetical protein